MIEYNEERSGPIFTRRVVKQGDPLSPFMFNAVIDWAFSALDEHLGFSFGDIRVNNLGYANDVALLSDTRAGLRSQLGKFESHLVKGGLTISAGTEGKSSLSISIDGKAKRWVVDHTPFLATNAEIIPSLSTTGEYGYLGIMLGAGGAKVRSSLREELLQGLNNITRAPLKPHQRMVILRKFLVPRFLQELVLAPVGDGWLRCLDTTLRANVCRWLKLPNDTPVAFFHAGVADDGLAVPSLRYSIPVMRRRRLEAICSATDPLSTALVASPFFKKELTASPVRPWMGVWCRTSSPLQRLGLIVCTPRWMGGVYPKRAPVRRRVAGCLTHPGINLGPITSGPLRLEAGSSPLKCVLHVVLDLALM